MGIMDRGRHCEFDSGNVEHMCELSGEACPARGNKDKCPLPGREKEEEEDERFTEKDHVQH